MPFTPFARYRNFTLANLKALLEVYPDMAGNISWDDAKDFAENNLSGYKRTAYQQACQLGLEDRADDEFRVHNYLYTFDDDGLLKYLVFWFKTYFAPNPYVKSTDEAFLLYCRLCEEIINSENHSVKFEDFVEKNIGGKSDDILLNAIKVYAAPVKYRQIGTNNILYIEESDIESVKDEILFIEENFPIGDSKSEHDFFKRFSYANYCKFYSEDEDLEVVDGEPIKNNKLTQQIIPFGQSKDCARIIIDCIYALDEFERISNKFVNNNKNIKIVTDDLGGNYLRYIFAKSSSDLYQNASGGKTRVFTDKDYTIAIDGGIENCRLSTEWVSSKLGESGESANYLRALIDVVNSCYRDVINIFEESGIWYLEYLHNGFGFDDIDDCFKTSFAERYIRALLAKPFVILTGNSGTGKTRIAKQFAQYLEKRINGRKNWLIVPVGADWTDNTKILGFYNPLDKKYVSTPTLDFLLLAKDNPSIPFFLILDEMNLSHVERYFSDFLSAMESDEEIPLYKMDEDITGETSDGEIIPEKISIPKNLFVTGTVNIDETTYMFSPKVLDRSNVIEFKPEKNDVLKLMMLPSEKENISIAKSGAAEGFVALAEATNEGMCNVVESELTLAQKFLDQIYDDLQETGFEFAYRTVKEIRRYLAVSNELLNGRFNITRTMDEQIVQKVLPKIYGDRKQIEMLLNSLEEKCKKGLGEDGVTDTMELSLSKIEQMKTRLNKYQYASYM